MRQLVLKRAKYFIFYILIAVTVSCDTIDYNIPNVPFGFEVNIITTPGLQSPGSTIFFPGVGFGGVLVYCAHFNGYNYEYYAFDAACTNEVSRTCIVTKDEEIDTKLCPCQLKSSIVACNCCGSSFNLMDGAAYPLEGPAILPLRQYKTTLNGSVLRVYN